MKKPRRRHPLPQRAVSPESTRHVRAGSADDVADRRALYAARGALDGTDQSRDILPHNPTLPDRAREQWLDAEWRSLTELTPDSLAHHPDRARLAALCAAASLQIGDRSAARGQALQAMAWGCSRAFMGQVLLSGARHTLGRASVFGGRAKKAEGHFDRAVDMARMSSEARRLVQTRQDEVASELRSATAAAVALRKGGGVPAATKVPAWLTALAKRCTEAQDVHETVDHVLATVLTLPGDKVQFLLLLADEFLARKDRLTALHFLRQARALASDVPPELRTEIARKMVAAGSPENAVDVMVDQVFDSTFQNERDDALALSAQQAYQKMRTLSEAKAQHGHDLLLAYLEREFDTLRTKAQGRKLTVIEIGTTREDVPGQGSTAKLAEFCKRRGLRFVTVDMDPHNSRMAQQLFARLGVDFEAVTMKGEDYLRDLPGEVDFVFLDAYDFDHGMHSELRQSRYEKFLGARIDELACHQMHLDCAQSLATKLWAHGVVCVDDTWLEDERWTAKGTLAMPFLLGQGFDMVEARNRAALLVRNPAVH
jgi:predicted O-methyltransferase YrrM